MSDKIIVLVHVDDDGFEIEPVIFDLYDEEGNLKEISTNLVPSNQNRLFKPKWDFDKKEWIEGDLQYALNEQKKMTITRYNTECNQLIESGFEYNGDEFAFSLEKDQANFAQQMMVLITQPATDSVQWMTENNGVKEFTRDEFFAICQAGEAWKRSNIGSYWKLKEYISNVADMNTLSSMGSFEDAIKLVQ